MVLPHIDSGHSGRKFRQPAAIGPWSGGCARRLRTSMNRHPFLNFP
jgi:hypothetical protein